MTNKINLKPNQIFKNFKDLWEHIGWVGSDKNLGGNTKKGQEKELKRYCNYEKIKGTNKIIILDVYDSVLPKDDGRNVKTEYSNFIMLIFYMLQKSDEDKLSNLTTLISKTKLFKELEICNTSFNFNDYDNDEFYVGYIFRRECSKYFNLIPSSLDNLFKRGLLVDKSTDLMVKYKGKTKNKIADEEDTIIYKDVENEVNTYIETKYAQWGKKKKLTTKEEKAKKDETQEKRKELLEEHNIDFFNNAISFNINNDELIMAAFKKTFIEQHHTEIKKFFGSRLKAINDFFEFDTLEIIDFCKSVLHYKYLKKCRTAIKSQIKYFYEKTPFSSEQLDEITKHFETLITKLRNAKIEAYDEEFINIYNIFQYYHISDDELIMKLSTEKNKSINPVEHTSKTNFQSNMLTSKFDSKKFKYPIEVFKYIKIKLTKDDIKDDVEFFKSAGFDEFIRSDIHSYIRCIKATDENVKQVKDSIENFQNKYLSLFNKNDEIEADISLYLRLKAEKYDVKMIKRSLIITKPSEEDFKNSNLYRSNLSDNDPCYLVFDIWEKKVNSSTVFPIPKEIAEFLEKCRNDFFALTNNINFSLGIKNVDSIFITSDHLKLLGIERLGKNILEKIQGDPIVAEVIKDFAEYSSNKLKELVQKYEVYLDPKFKNSLLNYEFYLILNNEKIVFKS